MNPQDPLAALHPLREPLAIGWWPPAAGWWVLLLLTLSILAVIGHLLWRRYQRNAYRRHALRQLDALRSLHVHSGDDRHYVEALNALLKSVALRAYPAAQIASRHGEPWRTFLNAHLPLAEQFTADFDNAAYLSVTPTINASQLHRSARYWIQHHKVIS
ncbi:MAG: DUF4381 domain-containing protein [Halioglobus sp.]|nr:DUF4381 domain-containing protein [Halioglobus sp.]